MRDEKNRTPERYTYKNDVQAVLNLLSSDN